MELPQDMIVGREIEVRGAFRFIDEFGLAVALIGNGRANVLPLVTQQYELSRVVEAFDIAGDRKRAMKVQVVFG